MARAGVGVGMLEVSRVERAMRRRPGFAARVFTADERRLCDRDRRPARRYAACLAARGAVLRALGTGLSEGVGRGDVSVGRDERGRPRAILSGGAYEVARERGVTEVALSISYTQDVAVANAVAMTDAARPVTPEREDPGAALRASFRQARSVLDELERREKDGDGDEAAASSRMPGGAGAIGE